MNLETMKPGKKALRICELILLLSWIPGFQIQSAPEALHRDTATKQLIEPELNLKSTTLTLGNVTFFDSSGTRTIDLGSTNGTKIGKTGDKIGFLGAAPIVRPTGNIFTALTNLGLVTTPSLTTANITNLDTSLAGKQPLDSDLTAIAALTTNSYGRGALALADGSAFISYLGKTTLAGYGITDGQPLDSDLTAIAGVATTSYGRGALAMADGTAFISYLGKTTLAGYGITDGQPLDSDLTAIAGVATTSYGRSALALADGSAFISYLGKTTLAGYGITDGQPLDSDLTAIAGVATTSYGRGALAMADGSAFISYLGKTTLAGYAITDAQPLDPDLTAIAGVATTSYGRGALAMADGTSFISYLGRTTLAGYGITDAVHNTGPETIAGPKTFTSTLTAPISDKGGEVFNVAAYGGLADDSTNNATAINAALTAGGSTPVLYFGAGTWRTGGVTLPANCVILGAGRGATILKGLAAATGGSSSTVFTIPSSSSNVTLRDLTLDGNRAGQGAYTSTGTNSVLYLGGSSILIENVEITHGVFTGVFIGDNSVSPSLITFQGCWIHDNGGVRDSSGLGIGIFTGGSALVSNLTLNRCTIENNYNTVTRPNDSSGANLTVSSVKITGCTFKNNYNVTGGQLGISDNGDGSGQVDAIVTHNHFIKTSNFGSPVDDTGAIEINGRGFTVADNDINGFTSAALTIEGAGGHGSITGNTIYGGPTAIRLYGLSTDAVSNVAISGNHLRSTATGIAFNNVNTFIAPGVNENSTATNYYTVTGGPLAASVGSKIIGSFDVTGPLTAANLNPTYLTTQTVASPTGTITFTGIPAGYHELSLIINARGTASAASISALINFNNDSGANYEWIEYAGATQATQTSGRLGLVTAATGPANYPGSMTVTIPDYAGSTFYKTFNSLNVYSSATATLVPTTGYGVWKNTAAITRVDINSNNGAFATGSTATLIAR